MQTFEFYQSSFENMFFALYRLNHNFHRKNDL